MRRTAAPVVAGRGGVSGVRRGRARRPLALGMAAVLVSLSSALLPVRAPEAAALVEPPPGGLVDSVANYGWTQGDFSVGDDGAAQYSLPLWVPQGRGRSTPKLALTYNSRAGNGLLGVGWSLSGLSSIGWCPRTIAQDGYTQFAGDFDGTDALCLDGNRLLPTSPQQLPERSYKTERATFSRITGYGFGPLDQVPDYFKVWAKDGLILTYGQTGDARLGGFWLKPKPDPANPNQPDVRDPGLVVSSQTPVTTSWALNRIEDRNGNAATIEYAWAFDDPNHADMTPSVIRYAPNREVRFVYNEPGEPRPDVLDGYVGGVHFRTEKRLLRIEMWGGPQGGDPAKLREYRLGYSNASVTRRSLLAEIRECDGAGVCKLPLPLSYSHGSDQFEALTVQDLAGDITSDNTTGDVNGDGRSDLIYWAEAPGADETVPWVQLGADTPSGLAEPSESGRGGDRPVDVDADGRTDMMDLRAEKDPDGVNGHRWRLYESDGSRFVERTGSEVGTWTARGDGFFSDPSYLADFDGNGLPDFVSRQHAANGNPLSWYFRLNTGAAGEDRFEARRETAIPGVQGSTGQAADTNGDGRGDLLYQSMLPDGTPSVWLSWGVTRFGGLRQGIENLKNDARGGDLTFGDVNGDGLQDAIRLRRFQVHEPCCPDRWELTAQLNSGNGFAEVGGPNPPTWTYFLDEGTVGQKYVADFNGDGRDDLLVQPFEQDREGHQVVELYEWRDTGFVRSWTLETQYSANVPLDVDADGVMDLVSGRPLEDGRHRVQVYRHLGGMPDLLIAAGDGATGPRVEVDYTTLADRSVHTPCSGAAYPLRCLTGGQTVVKQHRLATFAAAGEERLDRYDHDYRDARTDLHGRGWLGFASHTVTRVLTGAITVTEFDNTTRDGTLAVYYRARLPKTVSRFTPTGPGGAASRYVTTSDNRIRHLPGGSFTVERRSVTETEEERPPGVNVWLTLRSTTTTTTYDEFGNRDRVVAATAGGRTLTEDPTFEPDTVNWLVGLPTRNVTTGCDTANRCVDRTSTFDYYPNGDLETTVVEPDQPALRLATTTVYDTFGNPTSVTRTGDGRVRTETLEYSDPAGDKLYPTATTNAAGHRTVIRTDPGLGVRTEVTGPNPGEKTTMRYDRFGRQRETNRSDGSFERVAHASFFLQSATTTDAGGGVTGVVVDQLGRERERLVKAFDGRTATTYTDYDVLGRVSRTSRPAFAGEARHDTTWQYDGLNRPLRQTAPDGAVTRNEYRGLETHTFDAKGVERYTVANADGEVASAFEDDPESAGWLETTFEYDGFGQVTRIDAADDTAQTMHYDTLGRRDELVDPSSGTTLTGYNAFGDVTTETDGAGRTTTWVPDALGRAMTVSSPDGTATNTWDTAPSGIGRLASATSADGVTVRHTYNDVSKPQTSTWTIGGTAYRYDYDYDGIGRPGSTTYPVIPGAPQNSGRLKLTNVYNQHGYLRQVRDATAGTEYWTAERRNAAGQLERERLGDLATAVYTTRVYQDSTGLPLNVQTTGPGDVGTLVRIDTRYDLNRNVTIRHDSINKRHEHYDYDELNRLERWWTEAPSPGYVAVEATYGYDEVGNLESETFQAPGQPRQDVAYDYGQDGAPPHALTDRNGDRYTYDAAGRQLTGPRRAVVAYNRDGLPKVLDWGQDLTQRTEFAYDPDGARARKRDTGQTVIYAGGLFERRTPAGTGGAEIHNLHDIVVEGRVVAQVNREQAATGGPITRTTVHYVHADHQGSTVELTNAAGRPVGDQGDFLGELYYDPWGRRVDAGYQPLGRNRNGGPRQGYTGHYHDDEYGLIDMKGRWYDPEARRFLTPDPVLADPASSQGANRYAYVQNNPATLTDPTGHCPFPLLYCDDFGMPWTPVAPLGSEGQEIGALNGLTGISAVPGAGVYDDDSGYHVVPDETIEITGRIDNINGVLFMIDEDGEYKTLRRGHEQWETLASDVNWFSARDFASRMRAEDWDEKYGGVYALGETLDWVVDKWTKFTPHGRLSLRIAEGIDNFLAGRPVIDPLSAPPRFGPGPTVRFDRQKQYGGSATDGPAGRAIREAAEGQPCPRCGNPMVSGGKHAPIPEHKPSLLEHYFFHGGWKMTDAQRSGYARSPEAFDGALCASCQAKQGGALSFLSKYMNALYGF